MYCVCMKSAESVYFHACLLYYVMAFMFMFLLSCYLYKKNCFDADIHVILHSVCIVFVYILGR